MGKTKLGLDENIEAVLCYALFWISGIVFYFIEEDNKNIRFHALQSIFVFLPLWVIAWFFGGFFGIGYFWGTGLIFLVWISWLIWALAFILWLILMLKAFMGEKFKVPVVGDIVESQLK